MKKVETYAVMPVLTLVLLSVILGTSEFIIIGILPDIAQSIGTSLTMIGNLVSIFAFVYAIGTFFIMTLTSSLNRYYFIISLIIIFIVGNFLFAVAGTYVFLMIARMIIAVVSGAIIAISMTFSAEIAAPQMQAKVISWIFSGFSVAAVFGVPVGTFFTHVFGWRIVFFTLTIISIIVLLMFCYYLPNTGKGTKSNFKKQIALFKDSQIQLGFWIVIFGGGSTYVFYTYLTPLLQNYLHIPVQYISLILVGYGFCTILSNLGSGHIAANGGIKKLPAFFTVQAVALAALTITINQVVWGLINIFIIAITMYFVNSPLQMHFLNRAMKIRPEALNLSSSILPLAFNMGIAISSGMGSLIVTYTNMKYVGIGGAVVAGGAILCNIKLKRIQK